MFWGAGTISVMPITLFIQNELLSIHCTFAPLGDFSFTLSFLLNRNYGFGVGLESSNDTVVYIVHLSLLRK